MAKRNSKGEIEELSLLQQSILTILVRHPDGLYGLHILDHLNEVRAQVARSEVSVGSFYPTIKRMEADDLVKGYWGEEAAEGARRRYYQITSQGRAALQRNRSYLAHLEGRELDKEIIPGVPVPGLSWAQQISNNVCNTLSFKSWIQQEG
jgi:DNA-binding PadR family transcriptional regulator